MRAFKTSFCSFAAILLFAAVGCQTPAPPAADYAAELGPLAHGFIEAWNSKDYAKLDGMISADFQRIAPDQNAVGLDAMKEFMQQVHAAYPDFQIVVDESAYAEGLAFLYWTVTGTNTGEGAVAPSGKSIEVSGITMLRCAGGKITHEIARFDTATIQAQLGVSAVPHAAQ